MPENTGLQQEKKTTKFAPGQSGNPSGRPKGSRNKLTEDFVRDLCEAWEMHGKEAIEATLADSPKDFVKVCLEVVKATIPKKIDVNGKFTSVSEFSDDQLAALANLATAIRESDERCEAGEVSTGSKNESERLH